MFAAKRLIAGVALAVLAAMAQISPAIDDSARAANLMNEGLRLLGQRTPEANQQAVATYLEAAGMWRTLGDTSKELEALLNLATAHFNLHETSETASFMDQDLN